MDNVPYIYGSVVSPFVRKVLMVMRFKEISYHNESVIPFLPEGKQKLLTMNPLGKIPIYHEGDFILSDSSVICAYLDKKHPHHPIYPKNAEDYARCLWLEEYADTQLFPALKIVFFNTIIAPLLKLESNQDAVQKSLHDLIPPIFDFLDKEIGDKHYLVGPHLSLADMTIVAPFINFQITEHPLDATRWKNLDCYVKILSQESPIKELNDEVLHKLNKQ